MGFARTATRLYLLRFLLAVAEAGYIPGILLYHTAHHKDARLVKEGRVPREARLFTSSEGSVVRGYLKFRANIPPRWIKNARGSRKRMEPGIAAGFRSVKRLSIRRPRAKVAIRNAQRELRSVLARWETAYRKENFYRGIRILLELQREGSSTL